MSTSPSRRHVAALASVALTATGLMAIAPGKALSRASG